MAIIPTQNQYPDRAGYLGLDTDRNVLVGMSDGILQDMTNSTPEGWVNVRDFGAKGDGVTDDSIAFQKALDTGKTVFIPSGTFIVHDLLWNKQNNIYGSGKTTILKNNVPNSRILIEHDAGTWDFKKISTLRLIGNAELNNNGIEFYHHKSGRIVLDTVYFENFDKAIFKEYGNIGNRLYNCTFEKCNFHWYAQSSPLPNEMHAGCDNFIGCHFRGANLASIYIDNNIHIGQIVFDACIFEGNPGFALFIANFGWNIHSGIMMISPWFELNATSDQIIIENINYTPTEIYANNIEYFYISDSHLPSIHLIHSILQTKRCNFVTEEQVILENSRIRNTDAGIYRNINNHIIESVQFYQDRFFIHGIFMPPKLKTINGLPNNLKFSKHFNGTTPIIISGNTSNYTSSQVNDGVNSTNCSEFVINNGNNAFIDLPAIPLEKQYLIIANFKIISGRINFKLTNQIYENERGNLTTQDYFTNRWLSFAMFGISNTALPNRLNISDITGTSSIIRLSEVQMIEFNNWDELLEVLNSNAVFEN